MILAINRFSVNPNAPTNPHHRAGIALGLAALSQLHMRRALRRQITPAGNSGAAINRHSRTPQDAACPHSFPGLLLPYIVKTLFNQGRSWKFSSWTGNPTVCTRGESTLSNTYCNRFLRSCSSARQAFCCKTENTTLQADSPGFHRLRAGTRPDQGTGVAAHYHPCFQEAVKHYHLL